MTVERYVGEGIAANTYLVDLGDGTIMIDASCAHAFLAKRLRSPLRAVFITHAHADHIQHLNDLLSDTDIPVYAHHAAFDIMESAEMNLSRAMGMPFTVRVPLTRRRVIHDGEEITIGQAHVRVLGTPGHTEDGLSFIIGRELFTGDTLFCGSVGRADFPNSNAADLARSLERITSLKGDYTIHPGHDDETTLEEEIQSNPWLGGRSLYD